MKTRSSHEDYLENFHDNMVPETLKMVSTYAIIGTIVAIMVSTVYCFFPDYLPIRIWKFWVFNSVSIFNGILIGLPALVWGFFVSILLFKKERPGPTDPRVIMKAGLVISLCAGILEEIHYRWLLFYQATWICQALNWLLLGFIDINLLQWLHIYIIIPVANFLSFGLLDNVFYHPAGWFIGAALASSNGVFRNGHKQNGWFGFINSWFLGLYLFYIAFNYSIIAAIIIHVVYDILCFSADALCIIYTRTNKSRIWHMS